MRAIGGKLISFSRKVRQAAPWGTELDREAPIRREVAAFLREKKVYQLLTPDRFLN